MKITHLGHACVLVQTAAARILIDPGAFTPGFETLTELDAVLVTHQHVDHVDVGRLPVLLKANPGARLLVEGQTASELAKAGIVADTLAVDQQVAIGDAELTGVGGMHAEIHPDIPRIGNVGLLLREASGPTLFHPGDAYQAVPNGVDVLAMPLNAPWAKFSETAEFVRAIGPGRFFPVHDALLTPLGRGVYLRNLGSLLPAGAQLLDLAGAGATTL